MYVCFQSFPISFIYIKLYIYTHTYMHTHIFRERDIKTDWERRGEKHY